MSRIYLAGPGFDDEQLRVIHNLEELLEDKLGFEVYSPFRDGITLKPNSSMEDRDKVFEENVNEIYKSDILIAISDTRDTGTIFEQGVFYSKWMKEKNDVKARIDILGDSAIMSLSEFHIYESVKPRMILFTEKYRENISVMLSGACMAYCAGYEELTDLMNKIKEEGLWNVKRDVDSISRILTH